MRARTRCTTGCVDHAKRGSHRPPVSGTETFAGPPYLSSEGARRRKRPWEQSLRVQSAPSPRREDGAASRDQPRQSKESVIIRLHSVPRRARGRLRFRPKWWLPMRGETRRAPFESRTPEAEERGYLQLCDRLETDERSRRPVTPGGETPIRTASTRSRCREI